MQKLIDGELVNAEDLYLKYKNLLKRLSRPLTYRHGKEDAESTAALAFVEAFVSYDESEGVPFRPYMIQQVKFGMYALGRKCPSGVKVGDTTQNIRHKITRLELEQATAEEIAEITGCTVSMARNALLANQVTSIARMDAPTSMEGEPTTMHDIAGTRVDESELFFEICMSKLTERQAKIARYLSEGGTREDAARIVGVTEMTVYRELKKIIPVIQEELKIKEWSEMV